MDIIDVLNANKTKLYEASCDIRKKISELIDDNSFVELGTYSFGKNEFCDEELDGLGVVTGYARIDYYPVYIVAQNSKVLNGGLSKANCEKITNCLLKAGQTTTPVIYLLDSLGVQVGEGIGVLEGLASVINVANQLKGNVPQIAISVGDVYGSLAILNAICDYSFNVGQSITSYASPSVISASSKDGATKEIIGGSKAVNGLTSFTVSSLTEVKDTILKIFSILPNMSSLVIDTDDDLNRNTLLLNTEKSVAILKEALFDNGTFIELQKGFASEVITAIARVGGISVGTIIFDGGENGVELNLANVLKIKNFATYLEDNGLPFVNLVNVKGIKQDIETNNSPILKEITNMLYNLERLSGVSVVYGKAIGLGYTAFVSKEFGVGYSYAFADSKISLLDGDVGISATFSTVESKKIDELKDKYNEMQYAMNSARLGCVDNIIEPQYLRQYVISALQMLIRG